MKLNLKFLIAAIIVMITYTSAAQAQANLTFSGGNGSPLTITLEHSVTYTINNSQCAGGIPGPFFIFEEVGNPFPGCCSSVTGGITFSINGGAAQPITNAQSGFTNNNVSRNDFYVLGSTTSLPTGSTIVLSPGTITTGNVPGPPPANGSYATFITNSNLAQCSNNGVSAETNRASVSISGRVLTNSGRGVANASVHLTDSQGNMRSARTNPFGYYRLKDVSVGQNVTVTVASKRYQFAPKILNLNEEMNGVNFLADN